MSLIAQSKIIKGIEVKKDTSSYLIGNEKVVILTYRIYNKGNENIWLWISKDEMIAISDSSKIRDYFLKKSKGSDASLYQIGMDGNVEAFIPAMFETFITCILPHKCFTINIISKGNVSELSKQKIFSYLDNNVVMYSETCILKYIPNLINMSPIVFFKKPCIDLYLDMIMPPSCP